MRSIIIDKISFAILNRIHKINITKSYKYIKHIQTYSFIYVYVSVINYHTSFQFNIVQPYHVLKYMYKSPTP